MKIHVGVCITMFVAFVAATPNAIAQVETTGATAGYWNYSANPSQPAVVNRVDQQSNIGDGSLGVDVSSSAAYNDPTATPSIGTATANATIFNEPVLPVPVLPVIGPLVGGTLPTISLSTQATSTYPANVSFNGNLPFASATATISDSIKFCVASAGGCGALTNLTPAGYALQVTVNYGASLHSTNGSNIGAAIGTSLNFHAAFDGLSSPLTELINQGTSDFAYPNGSTVYNITGFNPNDLNSFAAFSLLADISASPYSDGSENVTFDDPITLTLRDSNGNIIPNLFVESQNGFFYDVTDGAVSATSPTSATPIPAALPLFATGIGGLGLLGWRRRRKGAGSAAREAA
jgi:hypothetical protein